jgi:hypothetical protein
MLQYLHSLLITRDERGSGLARVRADPGAHRRSGDRRGPRSSVVRSTRFCRTSATASSCDFAESETRAPAGTAGAFLCPEIVCAGRRCRC